MKLLAISHQQPDISSGWSIERCEFRPSINLIVGASGAGKTRLLNVIFNLARFAVTDTMLGPGNSYLEFSIDNEQYRWSVEIAESGKTGPVIISEGLEILGGRVVLARNEISATLNGVKLPKLPKTSSALRILREEDALKPIHAGFSSIRRRAFQGSELEQAAALGTVPGGIIEGCKRGGKLSDLYVAGLSISALMKVLHDYFREQFNIVADQFKRVFPNVLDLKVVDAQQIGLPVIGSPPVLMIRERGISKDIPIGDLSSGMLKVLLLITDVITQPKPSIYMIDEYENSLGVNAIDFFPGLARELGTEVQFFLTSHHPMLVNAMSINDWIVLGRTGQKVRALYGEILKSRYGISHHEQYIQLLNDPFYQKGTV